MVTAFRGRKKSARTGDIPSARTLIFLYGFMNLSGFLLEGSRRELLKPTCGLSVVRTPSLVRQSRSSDDAGEDAAAERYEDQGADHDHDGAEGDAVERCALVVDAVGKEGADGNSQHRDGGLAGGRRG